MAGVFLLLISCASGEALAQRSAQVVQTDIRSYRAATEPFLKTYCLECHGAVDAEAKFRVDNIDGLVTNGKDVERWEKVLEMVSIGDMPPEDADSHPDNATRRHVQHWITTELKKIGRGPDDSRLIRPEFGNRIDHNELFSGEHRGPAYSPPRLWRKNSQIHKRFETSQRLKHGNSPFNANGGHSFQDYGSLKANESTIKTLRINAKNYIAEIVDGRLTHPPGADGKPDKTKQVREGKSRWREFNELAHSSDPPTTETLDNAVSRAFELLLQRRPEQKEIERYSRQFLTRSVEIAGPREGLGSLLMALFLSPEFIYRQEIGLGKTLADGRRMLAPREIAYALAYALTDSPPDAELTKAVEEGKLSSREDVSREVRRMLATSTAPYWDYEINHTFESHVDACPNPRVLRFFREFFGYDRVFDVFKDKTRNPHHKPQFLFKDADLFVLAILKEDRQVLKELLTSNRYVVHYVSPEKAKRKIEQFHKDPKRNERALALLAKGITPVLGGYRGGKYYTTYGFETDGWNYPMQQPFSVPHRAGMLTHPAWLVAHSGNFDTDPIRRGKWIREHLLAGTIPEIPIGIDAALKEDPHKTLRERLSKTSLQLCWRCHKKMNPLGLAFEGYDDFGRYRDQDYFDAEGVLAGTYFERQQRIKLSKQRKQPGVTFTSRPIDTTGKLTGSGDPNLDGEVDDAIDLVQRLAKSKLVRQSFVRHAFRYWMGRNETYHDSPTLMAADAAYVDSDGSFNELLVSLLTSDSFLLRKDED